MKKALLPLLISLATTSLSADAGLLPIFPAQTVEINLRITDGDQTKDRHLQIFGVKTSSQEKLLAQLTAPAFLTNLKFLRLKASDKPAVTWLKTSRGTKRLAPEAPPEALFGSHFSTDDFSPLEGGDLTVQAADTGDGQRLQTVHLKSGASRLYWSDPKSGLLIRAEYYSPAGQLSKRLTLVDQQTVNGQPYPRTYRMDDLEHSGHSELMVEKVTLSTSLPDSLFNSGGL